MMAEYRFTTKTKWFKEIQVLQKYHQIEVGIRMGGYPEWEWMWLDATRWEAEEFLRSKSNG